MEKNKINDDFLTFDEVSKTFDQIEGYVHINWEDQEQAIENAWNETLTFLDDTKNISREFDFVKKEDAMDIFLIECGVVVSVGDAITRIKGLKRVANGEMVTVLVPGKNLTGMVLNLQKDLVSIVILGEDVTISPGTTVIRQGNLVSVAVSSQMLGRIVNPLGEAIDGQGDLLANDFIEVERVAPSIISRTAVNQPLETGLKVVDSLVPIGHGQRELIIGDAKTGKTSIALDTILNQRGSGTICIYAAIGQKRATVARIAKMFKNKKCDHFTTVLAATSSESPSLQFISPYSACSVGEYFMELGLKVLCIYDDLSKHAVAYRQISLLLRRPPGREGYPGDVFYAHSRLLERSANLAGKGSLTALPIVETIQGDVAAYIPTNVISITDGQIFLEKEMFAEGIRPAVSPGLSVSRVGSAAQSKPIKQLSGSLKLDLAQFREVEGFARLGLALDDNTKMLVEKV